MLSTPVRVRQQILTFKTALKCEHQGKLYVLKRRRFGRSILQTWVKDIYGDHRCLFLTITVGVSHDGTLSSSVGLPVRWAPALEVARGDVKTKCKESM